MNGSSWVEKTAEWEAEKSSLRMDLTLPRRLQYSVTEELLQSVRLRTETQGVSRVSRETRRGDKRMGTIEKGIQDVVRRSVEAVWIFKSHILPQT